MTTKEDMAAHHALFINTLKVTMMAVGSVPASSWWQQLVMPDMWPETSSSSSSAAAAAADPHGKQPYQGIDSTNGSLHSFLRIDDVMMFCRWFVFFNLSSPGDVWCAAGACCHHHQGHGDAISAVAWSADGCRLATACDDMQLRVFDIHDLKNR
jgi:WD40 repeat protein